MTIAKPTSDTDTASITAGALVTTLDRQAAETMQLKERFFAATCRTSRAPAAMAMAEAFGKGERLYVFGNGGSSCDAVHVSVEFMHPIIEKRPALPAVVADHGYGGDDRGGQRPGLFTGLSSSSCACSGSAGDMALGISTSGKIART